MKATTFSPVDLEPILKIASECGLILVGRQAVGCWATLLEMPEEEPWKSCRPYTSRDADALCTRNQMLLFAKSLTENGWEVEVFEPNKQEERINTGAVRIRGMIGNRRQTVEMNLLKQLEGLSNQEIEETATEIPLRKSFIRTIDSLRLLESKTISLRSLDQTARQDGNHLLLCIATLKKILEQAGEGAEWQAALQSAQRIIQNANHQVGLDVFTRHKTNLLDAIPWETWRNSGNPSLAQFGCAEAEHRQKMLDSIQTAMEPEVWFRELNPKSRK